MDTKITDYIKVHFNNLDGSLFNIEKIDFEMEIIAEELFIEAKRPSEDVRKFSCEEIYREDMIEAFQDEYKMKVKQLNFVD